MKRVLVLILMVLPAIGVLANGEQEAVEPAAVSEDFKRVENENLTFDWKVVGDSLEVRISAATTGWVAIGFEPSRAMQDANIIIGYVSGDEVTIEDHFGNSLTGHRADEDLGGTGHVTIIGGSESDGRTELHFSIPLDSGDEYDQALTPGKNHTVIYAFGADGQDNARQRHATRGSFVTTL